jgi:hypothetical protein
MRQWLPVADDGKSFPAGSCHGSHKKTPDMSAGRCLVRRSDGIMVERLSRKRRMMTMTGAGGLAKPRLGRLHDVMAIHITAGDIGSGSVDRRSSDVPPAVIEEEAEYRQISSSCASAIRNYDPSTK